MSETRKEARGRKNDVQANERKGRGRLKRVPIS
jgi:hypothetical protein